MSARIRKDDLVEVIAGKDRGVRGRVLRILREVDRVIVEGVNQVTRHQRPTPASPEGGLFRREAPIHVSNVMPVDTKADKRTRVRMGEDKTAAKFASRLRAGAFLMAMSAFRHAVLACGITNE